MTAPGHRGVEEEGHDASATFGDFLAEYRRRKFELAELIRVAMALAERRRDEERTAAGRELLARLAEDRFLLAVVGQFSRGKSTLINALLGRSYLPMGALPMTSVVTTIRYGTRPRAIVRRAVDALPIEVAIEDITRYVSQESAEREAMGVVSLDVELPAEILRLGVSVVDTPGVGSAVAANSAATIGFLPEADAVIVVTSVEAPLGDAELRLLDAVRRYGQTAFLVVNKADLASDEEIDQVMRYVCARASDLLTGAFAFAISARNALDARIHGEVGVLEMSGIPRFEAALDSFLAREKPRSFLMRMAERVEGLLAGQRLDLQLGRLADARADEVGARTRRFEERIADVVAEERDIIASLGVRLRSELPGRLDGLARAWRDELEVALSIHSVRSWSPQSTLTARDELDDAKARLEEAAEKAVPKWYSRRLPEFRSLVLGLAADHLGRLAELKHSVERASAEAFGLPVPSTILDETPWTPADVPQLATPTLGVEITAHPPLRFSIMSTRRAANEGRRLLEQAAERAIAAAEHEAGKALRAVAERWVDDLRDLTERETLRAASRVRARIETASTDVELRGLEDVQRRLDEFRGAVSAWDVAAWEAGSNAQIPTVAPPRALSRCPICEELVQVTFRYMADVQHQLATDPQRRSEHARSGGFCSMHTWQYAGIASTLGIALAYADLTTRAADSLRSLASDTASEQELQAAVARLLVGSDRCRACVAITEAEEDAIRRLVADLSASTEDGTVPPALCVRHAGAVLEAGARLTLGKEIVGSLADALARAADDMRAYALKRESLRRRLLTEEEEVAHLQAIVLLAEERELVRPWRRDLDELRS
jgi:ribosome biogenesis GTPase A